MEDQKNQQQPEAKTIEQRVRELEERADHQALVIEKLDRLVYKLFRRAKRAELRTANEAATAE